MSYLSHINQPSAQQQRLCLVYKIKHGNVSEKHTHITLDLHQVGQGIAKNKVTVVGECVSTIVLNYAIDCPHKFETLKIICS